MTPTGLLCWLRRAHGNGRLRRIVEQVVCSAVSARRAVPCGPVPFTSRSERPWVAYLRVGHLAGRGELGVGGP